MTARRLRLMTCGGLVGYGLGWADRAYGHAPIALLLLVAVVSWLTGFATARQHPVSERER